MRFKLPTISRSFRKKSATSFGLLAVLLLSFLVASPARAGIATDVVSSILGGIATFFIGIEGFILWVLTKALLVVVYYNHFVDSGAVQLGWVIVRDITNMFFVVILLLIGIATILRIEQYNFKRLLPKLILMAVLVNFSLVIAGFFIDVAQVIMVTFVVAFASTAGAGASALWSTLQIDQIINFNQQSGTETSGGNDFMRIVATLMLMVVLLLIAIVVILVILAVLVMRIIMLWVLLVLSPLAYVLSAFPQGQRYAQQWWSEFTKYVIIGPVLAFFLWLTFAIAGSGDLATSEKFGENTPGGLASISGEANQTAVLNPGQISALTGSEVDVAAVNGIAQVDKMLSFIIAIGMLMASLVITQQVGVAGSQFAGQMYSKIRQSGAGALRWTGRRADDMQAGVLGNSARVIGAGLRKVGFKGAGEAFGKAGRGYREMRYRAIPAAWKARSERVEKERLGTAPERYADIFNRVLPTPEKTFLAEEKRRSNEREYQKKLSDRTNDENEQVDEIRKVLGPNWKLGLNAKESDKNEVIGYLRELSKDRNANEVMAKFSEDTGKPIDNSAEGLTVMLRHIFGNESDAARAGAVLSPILHEAGDSHLFKVATGNPADGYKFSTPEDQMNEYVAHMAKKESQAIARSMNSQNVMQQTFDENGKRSYTGMNEAMYDEKFRSIFLSTADQHFNRFKGEFQRDVYENLDIWDEFASELSSNEETKKDGEAVKRFMTAIIGSMSGKAEKLKESDPVAINTQVNAVRMAKLKKRAAAAGVPTERSENNIEQPAPAASREENPIRFPGYADDMLPKEREEFSKNQAPVVEDHEERFDRKQGRILSDDDGIGYLEEQVAKNKGEAPERRSVDNNFVKALDNVANGLDQMASELVKLDASLKTDLYGEQSKNLNNLANELRQQSQIGQNSLRDVDMDMLAERLVQIKSAITKGQPININNPVEKKKKPDVEEKKQAKPKTKQPDNNSDDPGSGKSRSRFNSDNPTAEDEDND